MASIALGRRWLNELVADATTSTEAIAKREGCSVRKVNMTISLGFLAPTFVKAAIEGRLPRELRAGRPAGRMVQAAPDAGPAGILARH
jgi:hypothetical protein